MRDDTVKEIIYIADILEQCDFVLFWQTVQNKGDLFEKITGFYVRTERVASVRLIQYLLNFQDSVRKFVCHVVGTTFQTIDKVYLSKLLGNVDDKQLTQWVKKNNWTSHGDVITIIKQDETIKTKHIAEKIDFESLGGLMGTCL